MLLPSLLFAQQQTIEATDNLNQGRIKMNANFTELYLGNIIVAKGTATGTNTYVLAGSITSYSAGQFASVTFTSANSSTTVTLNINSIGAAAVKDNAGADLAVGDIKDGGTYLLRHNGTNFRVVGATGGSGGSTCTPVVNEFAVSHTLALTDVSADCNYEGYLRIDAATATVVTVPLNATADFEVGAKMAVLQAGAGQVTVTATGGVSLNAPGGLTGPGQGRTMVFVYLGADEWDLLGTGANGSISGLTSGFVPSASAATTIVNSGVKYSIDAITLRPSTNLLNIPGLNAGTTPMQFYNHGYLTGTDTTVFPNDRLINTSVGFIKINWSLNIANNWKWDDGDQRAEPEDVTLPMLALEIGGEAPIIGHYTAPGNIPATAFHETVRLAGGGVEGLSGVDPYTTHVPFNQFKATIFAKYTASTTPSAATNESWWGGSTNTLESVLNPLLWLASEEPKGTDNEFMRVDGYTTPGNIYFRRAQGSFDTKTACSVNVQTGGVGAQIYDGTAYQRTAEVFFFSQAGAISSGVAGGGIKFRTSATNTAGLANRMEIHPNGNIAIGGTTPTALMHFKAGTTAASSGPIKLTEGVNPTTPEDGIINYVANNVTFTETSTVYTLAKTLTATATLNFDLTSVNSQDLTITVTGAAAGEAVSCGVDAASATANVIFTWWVSATNTVTIRASRIDVASGADPASGTFRAAVIHY